MVSELIGKYIWLIQTLSAAGDRGLSLHEITDKYEHRFDQPYSRRTFNNHRIAIADVFGVDIQCNRRENRYFIPFGDEVMDDDKSVTSITTADNAKTVIMTTATNTAFL